MGNLPQNQHKPSTHLSVERVAHREWIGGRCVTLLSHFWREDDPVELTAAIGKDWADVLEGLPQEFIDRACVQYLREESRKPKPADIYQRAKALMPPPRSVHVEGEEPREPRVTKEAAAEIVARAGYAPRRTPEAAKEAK